MVAVWVLGALVGASSLRADVTRQDYRSNGKKLRLEVMTDQLIRFHYTAGDREPSPDSVNPMIESTEFEGPETSVEVTEGLATGAISIVVDKSSLCASFVNIKTRSPLTSICPQLAKGNSELTLTQETSQDIYGLGEQFVKAGESSGNWMGKVRTQGKKGNEMVSFHGGAVGNALFPIMYVLGEGDSVYGVFIDQFEKQQWDFRQDPWKLNVKSDQVQGYLIFGEDLKDVRARYLAIVGRPPVPPKKAFGLWVSEYGFDSWGEMDYKLASLRANHFPVDGFVLDLQWFGGITTNSDYSNMGSLAWDLKNFPDPKQKIHDLAEQEGLGIVAIEESYVSRGLDEHRALAEKGYLARDGQQGPPTYLTGNPWWGKGGMIDWTNPEGGDFWHDWKRQALIEDGIMGHWTDLGEPEMYDENSWYYGFPSLGKHSHDDIHNAFNLLWSASIVRGYERHQLRQRPWILSRSGTSGSQRLGVSMWSGDIGSNLESLASHFNTQMHMSLSGMDYYGSDVGGFHRTSNKGDLDEMYTQWFAASAMVDVPLRPHTLNLCNCNETSPDRIGDQSSNLENLRLRYRLTPYLYSLAHQAHLKGDAIFPPLVYHFPGDSNVRKLGDHKMLGDSLLTVLVAEHGAVSRDVYLPQGEWINYHTLEKHHSEGEWLREVPLYYRGVYRLPLFVRAGAILPMLKVDKETLNLEGRRTDGTDASHEFRLRIYRGDGEFTAFEDDGKTISYREGWLQSAKVTQRTQGKTTRIQIGRTRGYYKGARWFRKHLVEFVSEQPVASVAFRGRKLELYPSLAELNKSRSGWVKLDGEILIKTGYRFAKESKWFDITVE